MRDFFLAPILSLFSLKFYRRLVTVSQVLGFLYLAYLSFLVAFVETAHFRTRAYPIISEFVGWMEKNLPEMVVTSQGVQMIISEPKLLTHPRWGPVIYLDPTSDFPKQTDWNKAPLILARQRIAYRGRTGNNYQVQDLIPKNVDPNWRGFVITGEKIMQYWKNYKPMLGPFLFASIFVFTYFWKLIAGLLYSLLGIGLNRFRSEKLPYPFVLNLTFFALTPVIWLQLFSRLLHWHVPLSFLTAFVLTALYLAFAILGTQRSPAPTE